MPGFHIEPWYRPNHDIVFFVRCPCVLDGRRYFVINGSEKVLIAQERINNNQIYIFRSPKGFFEAQIRSVTEKSTRPGLALYVPSLVVCTLSFSLPG